MSLRKFFVSSTIFMALLVVFFDAGTAFADTDPENVPIDNAKKMILDEKRSIMFIINQDSTVSAYDLIGKTFILSKKSLPNIKDVYSASISPDGSSIALFSSARYSVGISIFTLDNIIGNQASAPVANYGIPTAGSQVFGKFSADSKTLIVASGNTIFFLGVEKIGQETMAVSGGVPTEMEIDKYGRLLVLKEKSADLDVISVAEKKVLATIPLGSIPKKVLYNGTTDRLYVSHIGSEDIYVIDAQKMEVVEKIKVGSDPVDMSYDQNIGTVFVANNSAGTISIIAPDFSVKTADLHSPAYWHSLPLSLFYLNGEKKLFVINSSIARLYVYDVVQDKVVREEKTDFSPAAVFGSEKLKMAFVEHNNADSIYEIDGKALNVRRIPETQNTDELFFSKPQGIAIDLESNKIFVTNKGDNTITVIDGETQKPLTKISVGASSQAIVFQPETKKLYSISPTDNAVAVIDTTKEEYPVKVIQTGKQPNGIAMNITTNRIYVSNATDSSISVIDGSVDEVVATIPLLKGSYPLILSANSELDKVYTAAY
ncbi:MAG: YncE family protein, partial [Candidatus Uhrbacteria bacterium]|nr:YncE family protein [Candidatus Uhrbacteria bacterium]